MNTRFYDTDVTDAAWAWVGPVLPRRDQSGDRAQPTFVPSSTPSFASRGQADSGDCYHAKFPPCGTVYHYFRAWQNSGVWVHLHRVLYERPVVMPDEKPVLRW